MICFLTSYPFLADQNRLNPENGLLEELRMHLNRDCAALFLCSDPDSHEKTLYFADAVRTAFEADGFRFRSFETLDGINRTAAKELIDEADFLILAGGHVPTQNRFFQEIGLRNIMASFKGCVLGISAGTMNAAELVYAQPEEEGEAVDPLYQRFLPGLGLTGIQILPHYQSTRHEILDGLRVFEDITYPDSMGRSFIALVDGSWLYLHDGKEELRGEAFQIRDGVLHRICKRGEYVDLGKINILTERCMDPKLSEEKLVTLRLPYPGREDRLVRVFVPACKEGETLPVIYMSDGQNLFDKETSGFGCWYVREAVRVEQRISGKAAVIVGIHNDDPLRMDDLTPASIGELCSEETKTEIDPCGERFAAFLIHTVMPTIEMRFPVKSGRENTAFCGSSAGGMMAFFLALQYPELFSYAGVLSPAFLLYRDSDFDRWLRQHIHADEAFLYLYSGAGDPLEKDICERFRQVCSCLEDFWRDNKMLWYIKPEERHHETAWEPVFQDFLHQFLNP